MSQTNKKLELALAYARMGISVIPWGDGKKKPYLKEWGPYKTKCASEDEIRTWWKKWPNANPFGVMGVISGMVMLDIDTYKGRSEKEFDIPATACSRTARGGLHFFFKHPGFNVSARDAIFDIGVDFKGDNGLAALPGTVYTGIGHYEWIIPLEDGLADMPEWLLAKITNKGKGTKEKPWKKGLIGVDEGERNSTAISMAGKILYGLSPELHETIGWESFKAFGRTKCTPPLDDDELLRTWKSALKYHQEGPNKGRVNPAEVLVNLALTDPNILLYTDDTKKAFVRFTMNDHMEHRPCNSNECKAWLRRIYWNETRKSISAEQVKNALGTLESLALFDGPSYELSVRVATDPEGIRYYSLSNSSWEAVKITVDGWSVVKEYPIIFRHYSNQTPQFYPIKNGDAWKIFDFINLKNEDEKIILLVWVVACFISGIPQPMLYLNGQQGAAKSTTSRLLKKIIDPCAIEICEMQKDELEFIQYLAHNHGVTFDNVSKISSSLSDTLCRVITGTGGSKREKYSDDSDIIYKVKKRICINGINRLKLRPDLAERTIFIELDRVDKKARRDEEELFSAYDETLPIILGGIFDAVVLAMKIKPTVQLDELPRMADFAKWGYAIAEALGYGGKKFIDTYFRQLGMQISQSIEDDFVCSFVVEYMETNKLTKWEISASDLMDLIKKSDDYDEKQDDIPTLPNKLSEHLNVVKTLLAEGGINFSRVSGGKRKLVFQRGENTIAPIASSSPAPEPETNPIDYDDF